MTETDILNLARLARIRLSEPEVKEFSSEIDDILAYVGAVNALVTDEDTQKKVGVVHNVFREDEVSVEPGSFSKNLLEAMPERGGSFLKVKKILNPSE